MGGGADAGDVDEEEEEEECTSLLIGETLLEPPDMAGAMSFLPKLSRLLETLLMLRGAAFALEPELERQKYVREKTKDKNHQTEEYLGFASAGSSAVTTLHCL